MFFSRPLSRLSSAGLGTIRNGPLSSHEHNPDTLTHKPRLASPACLLVYIAVTETTTGARDRRSCNCVSVSERFCDSAHANLAIESITCGARITVLGCTISSCVAYRVCAPHGPPFRRNLSPRSTPPPGPTLAVQRLACRAMGKYGDQVVSTNSRESNPHPLPSILNPLLLPSPPSPPADPPTWRNLLIPSACAPPTLRATSSRATCSGGRCSPTTFSSACGTRESVTRTSPSRRDTSRT